VRSEGINLISLK